MGVTKASEKKQTEVLKSKDILNVYGREIEDHKTKLVYNVKVD